MKLYTVAGTSTHNGKNTYRFATSMSRAAVLARNGHEHVALFLLPEPMTKESAIEFLRKGSLIKQIEAARVDKPKSKESVLWRSMSKNMRSIPGMETLQYAGE
jgi:hypothetical protein